jgi:hypothetical protein
MAEQSMIIKDGTGAIKALSVYSGSLGYIPEHVISGTVQVSASSANPVYVTGTVSISQPVNVDVVVGDSIAVTSSISSPLYVSSSNNSPLLVTGTVSLASNQITASISGTPTVTLSSNQVTASINNFVSVTSSIANPVAVTGTVATTLNLPSSLDVTASTANPVAVTGTVATVINFPSFIDVTSSNSNPVFIKQIGSVSSNKTLFSVFGSPVDYTSSASGTFALAQNNTGRTGLYIFNRSADNLYVSVGSGSTNGFTMDTTSSAPALYSFILYPSGTYIAEYSAITLFHGGFFVSSSNVSGKVNVTEVN